MIKDEKKAEILKEFKQALSDYSEMYTEQYEFTQNQLQFFSGDQWLEGAVSQRRADYKPYNKT